MNIYYHNGRSNICGTQVREKRLHLGLSQEQLAAQIQIAGLDITQRAVSRNVLSAVLKLAIVLFLIMN